MTTVAVAAAAWLIQGQHRPPATPATPGASAPSPAAAAPSPGAAVPSPAAAAPSPGAAPPSPGEGSPAPLPGIPAVQMSEGRLSAADPAGRLQWELEARGLVVDNERQEVRLEQVTGHFYEQGRRVVTVAAAGGVFDLRSRDVSLTGGVRAHTPTGRRLAAARVHWNAAARRLTATGGVRLVQGGMEVRADRLESDVALRRTRLVGHIRVRVHEAER
ncbi:MAG: LPS export ABC transporter periplasmic protein LptC [Armatimonadota bacterium]|nr:LPS export ABC transporter periplasmic protein LptC [Armatimonadota bacterium]MDR7459305.1 LPS export ABC transporter periplasmic protein LptC [Armatimonadota bacterium]MDR7591992.1 LPS export ABC transporter periplasmic protein LptC [Armatimonadota bacterium]